MIDKKMKCDICKTNKARGVYSSRIAPFSLAKCDECMKHHSEPTNLVEVRLEMNNLADWVLDEMNTYFNGAYMTIREYRDGKIAAEAGMKSSK